jgi:hypothetical protein
MNDPCAPEERTDHPAQTLLEHLLSCPFLDENLALPLLLQETSEDGFDSVLDKLEKIYDEHAECLQDLHSQKEFAEHHYRYTLQQVAEREEGYYWSQTSTTTLMTFKLLALLSTKPRKHSSSFSQRSPALSARRWNTRRCCCRRKPSGAQEESRPKASSLDLTTW